jgi:DNA-binding MarR family transcriptional regulator
MCIARRTVSGSRLRGPGVSASHGEAHILAHLHAEGESSIAQLHQALEHRRSTLTSILDRLAERKLITRAVDAKDRRSFRIRLTPSGAKAAAAIHRHLAAIEQAAMAGMTPAQMRTFHELITRLAVHAESQARPRRRGTVE